MTPFPRLIYSVIFILIVTALCLPALSRPCRADTFEAPKHHCITRFENGSINWTTGMITATGKASPQGKTEVSKESVPGSARADASRRLIGILKQIQIHPALTVEAYAAGNDIILAGIEKTARDADVIRQHYTSDLAVEILVKTRIPGGFLQLVLPEDIRQIPRINPDSPGAGQKAGLMGKNTPYTGMIIDARGLGVTPVLSPVIISEEGHDIYSGKYISREFAVQNGTCTYLCSMEKALKERRIGNTPLILRALRKEGKQNAAIVISMSDYLLLEKAPERHRFLKECRVVIVAGQ